jgi:hypothetical protein
MAKKLSKEQVLKILNDECKFHGVRGFANMHGFNEGFIFKVRTGERELSERLCTALGIKKLTVYERNNND